MWRMRRITVRIRSGKVHFPSQFSQRLFKWRNIFYGLMSISDGLSSSKCLQRALQLDPVPRAAHAEFLHLVKGQLLGKLKVDAVVDEDVTEVAQVVHTEELFNAGWL